MSSTNAADGTTAASTNDPPKVESASKSLANKKAGTR